MKGCVLRVPERTDIMGTYDFIYIFICDFQFSPLILFRFLIMNRLEIRMRCLAEPWDLLINWKIYSYFSSKCENIQISWKTYS